MNSLQEKLLNAILFYLDRRVKYPTVTKIFKLLWFSDCYHVMRAGVPIFNFHYEAWPFGPVPRELMSAWRKSGKWTISEEFSGFIRIDNPDPNQEVRTGNLFVARKKPNMLVFSPFEQRILDEVAFTFKEISPSDISDLTHIKNAPWTKTLKDQGEKAEIDLTMAIEDGGVISRALSQELIREREENIRAFQLG